VGSFLEEKKGLLKLKNVPKTKNEDKSVLFFVSSSYYTVHDNPIQILDSVSTSHSNRHMLPNLGIFSG